MKGYKTSKDYKHLKELVETGLDVVCFVTWDFDCFHMNLGGPQMYVFAGIFQARTLNM